MRIISLVVLALFTLTPCFDTCAQNQAAEQSNNISVRDPQALRLVLAAAAAMGGTVPNDATVSGTVSIGEGPNVETGTILILAKGTGETFEQTKIGGVTNKITFVNGRGNDTDHFITQNPYSLELAVNAQNVMFPLPFVSVLSTASDWGLKYIGAETIDGIQCQHLLTWNSYASVPDFQFLTPLTYRDIWFDSMTGLPIRIAYAIKDGSGAVTSTSIEISFSAYRSVNGVQFPFQVTKLVNGSPITVNVSSVTFNSGLLDSTFTIQ